MMLGCELWVGDFGPAFVGDYQKLQLPKVQRNWIGEFLSGKSCESSCLLPQPTT